MTVIEMNKRDKDWTGSNTWVVKGHEIWEAVDGEYFKTAIPYSMKFLFRNASEKEIAEYLSRFGFPWESIDWY